MASASEDQIEASVERSTNNASTSYYSSGASSNHHQQHDALAQLANMNFTAIMPTERHAVEYNMRHKDRGLALIFNNEHFMLEDLDSRTGTNVDCENLARCLKQLEFEVKICQDYTYGEIRRQIEWAANQDHSNSDCMLVAIMSHGKNGFICARDTQYTLDSICCYFTAQHCRTLAGKPKLFFIQACRGSSMDPGITMESAGTQTEGNSSTSYKIPVHADFLIAYSTIPEFCSWRSTTRGSWFMQALCAELAANGKRCDILTLLTFVCQRVAVDFESCSPDTPEIQPQKQIPCISTMLTRILRFHDKNSIAPAGRV